MTEPEKCAELRWAPLNALPTPRMRYTQIGVELFTTSRVYAAMDWPLAGST